MILARTRAYKWFGTDAEPLKLYLQYFSFTAFGERKDVIFVSADKDLVKPSSQGPLAYVSAANNAYVLNWLNLRQQMHTKPLLGETYCSFR